ncbi:MAG: hypothetical protein AB1333_04350 [Patescibacteria group bacterium]
MEEKEKAMLWRWPLVAFVVIGIVYLVNYICGGSFAGEVKSLDLLWWDIPLPSFLSLALTGWWGNIVYAPLVYSILLFLIFYSREEMENTFFGFCIIATLCLFLPFGKAIVVIFPIISSFLLAFLYILEHETNLDLEMVLSEDFRDSFLISSVLPVSLFYPFGIVFLMCLAGLGAAIIGFLIGLFLSGPLPFLLEKIKHWICLKDIREKE